MKMPVTTHGTHNVPHEENKVPFFSQSVCVAELRSESPPQSIPPAPSQILSFSASNVFIRKLGATKSTREGLESKRVNARERGRVVEETKASLFSLVLNRRSGVSLSLSLSLTLCFIRFSQHTLHSLSPAAHQVSPWPAPPPPQLDSSSFWLATLQQVRAIAGWGREGRGVTGQTRRARGYTAGKFGWAHQCWRCADLYNGWFMAQCRGNTFSDADCFYFIHYVLLTHGTIHFIFFTVVCKCVSMMAGWTHMKLSWRNGCTYTYYESVCVQWLPAHLLLISLLLWLHLIQQSVSIVSNNHSFLRPLFSSTYF